MSQSMRQERRPTRHRLLAVLATAAVFAGSSAGAQTPSDIHIPAGSLEAALLSLAEQTHQQVLFPKDLVSGRKAVALNGSYTAEQAVHLLAPGISVTHAGPNVLVLRGASPSQGMRQEPSPRAPFGPETAQTSPAPDLPTVPSSAPGGPGVNTVSEVEVTGTHIRGGVSAAPLLVVTHADLERSGQTTVADALRVLPQNFTGGAAEGTVATGSDTVGRNPVFSSGLNLRGLGNNATLVLVDGRRMAGSGSFGDFSDASSIPSAAVDRVEVLLDGASAVYGSDAVGGVVNVILRKNLDGAETRFLAGTSTAGGAAEGQFSQTFGKRWDGGGVLFVYEVRGRNPLEDSDRPFSASADLRPFGGTDHRSTTNTAPGNIFNASFVPAFGIPAGQSGVGLLPSQLLPGVINLQNQRLGEETLPSQTVQTLYLSGDQAFSDRLTFSADARFSRRNFKAYLADDISTLKVTSANPFYVSPTGATSETIGFSFANDLPNPTQSGYAETLGGSLSGKLKLWGDWQTNAYVTFAQEIDQVNNAGTTNSLILNEALGNTPDNPATPFNAARDGYFNPFAGVAGANNPTVLSAISSGYVRSRGRDQVYSANLQADGTMWTLPGGPIKVALGVQAREETLRRGGSTFVSAAAPIPSASVNDSRNVEAAFVEAQVPLFSGDNRQPGLERLELSLAGRVEHYEAIGTTKNPKVGVLWSPVDGLTLRSTYGTSFRAPALRELDDPASFAPTQFPLNGGLIRTLLLGGGNPDLKPETATSWTAGVDISPPQVSGLKLGATWYDIQFKNRIGSPVSQDLVGALSDPTLSNFVDRITPTTNAADLAKITALLASPAVSTLNGVFPPTAFLAIVDNRYVNTAALHVGGIDLSAGYGFDMGGDRVELGANGSYTLRYDQQVTPTSPGMDRVGIVNFPVRFRGRATADWTRDRLTAVVALNYTSAYRDPLGVDIGDQPTLDLQLRFAPATAGLLKGTALNFNIRNVFDRAPPFYNNPFGYAYDPSNGDPIGRFVSFQLVRAW